MRARARRRGLVRRGARDACRLPPPLVRARHDAFVALAREQLAHNSMRMGIRLGRQRLALPFQHNDVDHLVAQLTRAPARCVPIIALETREPAKASRS